MLCDIEENLIVLKSYFDVVALKSNEYELDKVKTKDQYFSCIDPIWEAF